MGKVKKQKTSNGGEKASKNIGLTDQILQDKAVRNKQRNKARQRQDEDEEVG